jgi:hypothetical protein
MTIANIQKTVKAFVKAEAQKSAAILKAIKDHVETDKAFQDDSMQAFNHMVDAIKSTAKDASDDNAIPSTIKQYCTHLVGVANDKDHGIEWIIRQDSFGAIRKAYTNIQEAKRSDEKPKAKGEPKAKPAAKSLDPIMQALVDFRDGLKARGETKALQNFDHMLTETIKDFAGGNKPTQAPKAKAQAPRKMPKADDAVVH